MMNVLISIGNSVTAVLPLAAGLAWNVAGDDLTAHGKRDTSDAHWLAPKVVSSADVIV